MGMSLIWAKHMRDGRITVEALKAMEPDTIFAHGTAEDSPLGINILNTGKMLRWVAVRGGIHDWAIYCHWEDKSEEEALRVGDKVTDKNTIRRLVPCDDDAFAMYRY